MCTLVSKDGLAIIGFLRSVTGILETRKEFTAKFLTGGALLPESGSEVEEEPGEAIRNYFLELDGDFRRISKGEAL